MDARSIANDFFEIVLARKKFLIEIPLNCSQGETGTLLYLEFVQDNVTPSELSENINVSLPRIASVLNSLESKGLIIKSTDNIDKRKSIVSITKEGKDLILSKKEEAIDKMSKVIELLEEDEINEYIRLTKKIGKIVENNIN